MCEVKDMKRIISYRDLRAEVIRGKFGEYHYKSPRYGYKKAYKFNIMITTTKNDEIVSRYMAKYLSLNEMKQYIKDVYNFTETKDFTNMVQLYNEAKLLGIDYGYVRELKSRNIVATFGLTGCNG
jgi:hypothetical protein